MAAPRKHEMPSVKKTKKKKRVRARRRVIMVICLMIICLCGYVIWDVLQPPPQPPAPPVTDGDDIEDNRQEDPPEMDDPDVPDNTAVSNKERKPNYYTFLLVGTNDDYNTDTIMLGSVDTDKDVVNVVSIPRDTMVDVNIKIKKINNAYGRKGIDELRRLVQEVTGVYPDYYCLVNMDNFIEVVDVIDGVYFDVPYDMKHADADEKFNIDLKKGYQLLDGKKAIQLVRYRGTSASDYGRMEMQRDFLKAVGKKLVSDFTISQASDLISVMSKSIKTNMPVKDMVWFYVNVARTINFDTAISFDTMPGTTTGRYNGQDYVYLNAQSTAQYINEKINPYTTPITVNELNIIHLEGMDEGQ